MKTTSDSMEKAGVVGALLMIVIGFSFYEATALWWQSSQ